VPDLRRSATDHRGLGDPHADFRAAPGAVVRLPLDVVGDKAELGPKFGGLAGGGEGARVVAEPGPSVGEHGEHRDEHGEGTAATGVGEAIFEEPHSLG
jgi:hypothetical protein